MSNLCKTTKLRRALEVLPQVKSVGRIRIVQDIIKYISIETKSIDRVTIRQLNVNDSPALFDFYFRGLSEKSRRLFTPYPLFNTPPNSIEELSSRIADWQRENDWTVINLIKDKQIIGMCLLKRYRTEHVTSGLAVQDKFHGMGLGHLLQTIIIGQARLLKIGKFHVKVVSDNIASVRLHEKCGFKQTRIAPNIYKELIDFLSESDDKRDRSEIVDRHIIEMVIEFSYE